ncbi:hypothetical protein PC121_g16151 [Phytophthora cactorum]|nr:hypothetical protein PC121_g16151 [Phytophthora cactorum]
MRLHFLAGLTLIVVSIVHATGSDVPLPSASSSEGFRIASDATITGTRLLRSNSAGDASDDTRAGLSVPATEKLKSWFTSSEVTPEKLQSWLNKGKSVNTVFTRMHLKKAGHWTLQAPQFSTWLQYVDNLNARTSPKSTSAISTLTRQFGADELYGMIESAKFIPEIKNLATRLETDQVQYWATIRKDPDEVFRLFRLDEARDNILNSATGPQSALHKYWLSQGKAPSDVFHFLFPKKLTEDILATPAFGIWTKYLVNYNKRYPEEQTTMIDGLRANYNDLNLLSMLNAEKNNRSMDKLVDDLKNAMVAKWVITGEKLADLQLRFSHVENGDEMIQRFKELKKVSGNSS